MRIGTKITLICFVLAGAMLCATAYVASLLDDQRAVDNMRREADVLFDVVRSAVSPHYTHHGQLGEFVDKVAASGSRRVIFYNRAGRPIAPVTADEPVNPDARIRRVLDGRTADDSVFRANERAVYVRRAALIDSKERLLGAVEIRLDLPPRPDWLISIAWIGGIFLLAVAATMTLFVRRAVDRPVAQLMDGMDHVIKGDLTHALPLDRNDEVGKIAYRFNEMTSMLRSALREVSSSANAKLELEKRLRQTEKLATVGQLSAEIAHEVGTPLNVISGRAGQIKRKADKPEVVKKNAGIIVDQTERISRIIQQVLDMARAPIARRERVDLGRVVQDTVLALETQIAANQISVNTEQAKNDATAGDPDALQQVVLNLAVNAIQAMPRGGELLFRLEREHRRKEGLDLAPPEPFVVLTIDDSGEGIAEEMQKRVFEPFFSTKSRGSGTGLGLAVSLGIVKEHDGWIDVGQSPSGGARFRVYLPAFDQADEEHEGQLDPMETSTPSAGSPPISDEGAVA